MQQNGELSVEEILESIKKVIARDNKESARVERYRRETEGVVLRNPGRNFGLTPVIGTGNDDNLDEEGEEILDLSDAGSEVFDNEEAGEAGQDTVGQDTADHDAAELIEPVPFEIEEEVEPAHLPEATLEIQNPVEELAAPMVRHSLEAPHSMQETTAETETAAQQAETPLERMVRESLRPMIREWLDTNLEPIVERMVKGELERIMGKLS